jgi:hypothetical protein
MTRPRKKTVIPPSRLRELRGNVVYEIRCGTFDCGCRNPQSGCKRGFFSLFIQAVNGIVFSKRFQLPYYVNFGHTTYAYSQPGDPDRNFWNYYFDQPIKDPVNLKIVENELIETYPLRIWDRSYIRSAAGVMSKELLYRDEVAKKFSELKKKFEERQVLGVHFRATDHPGEVTPVRIEDYFREIDRRQQRFEKIFLATDDFNIETEFSNRYGDKLWRNPVIRSLEGKPLHQDEVNDNKYQLGLDALVDCYALSLCSEALLTHSNLSYSALLFNPELKYKLMERPSTKAKKLLTLTLYYLDKWNIRKW